MAANPIPTNSGQFIGLAGKMKTGIDTVGSTVPVTMVTAAEIQAELDVFIDRDNTFNRLRSAKQNAADAFQGKMEIVYDWLLAVASVLTPRFGTRWSTAWAQAGFINNSTAIPTKIEDRLALAQSLQIFFTNNPSYEVPTMGITAAQGKTVRDAAVQTQGTFLQATATLVEEGTVWQSAYDALAASMRALIKNLDGKLAGDDPRWLKFGLQMPWAVVTPGQPVNLTAGTDGSGQVFVQCDPVPLATRYRWRMLLVGVEDDYRLVARSVNPLATITGLLPGQTAQFMVQAVNGNAQGVGSAPLLFTMPITAHATPATPAPAAASPHRNGSTRPASRRSRPAPRG